MIEVTGPDGAVIRFPDGTPQDVITRVMRERYGGPSASPSAPINLRPQAGESREDYRARIEAARPGFTPDARTQAMDAQALAAMTPPPREPPRQSWLTQNVTRPLLQGMTFGFGDEIVAGTTSALSPQTYDQALAAERTQLDRAREEAPFVSAASEIGGALIPATVTAPAMAGAGIGRQALTMAGLGALEGAAYGFGTGEGGLMSRLGDAGVMGLAGGALGAVAPAAVAGVSAITRPVAGAVRGLIGVGSQNRAADYLARVMDRAGTNVDDVGNAVRQAGAEGQDVYTTADALGNAGQRALAGIARTPGEARQAVQEALMNRQLGQADRVGGFVGDALQLGDDTAAQIRAAAEAERRATGAINYPAADEAASPVDLTGVLDLIDSRLGPIDQGGIRATNAGQALQRYRSMLEVAPGRLPAGVTNMTLSDFPSVVAVKSQLGDDISALLRAGRNSEAAQLIPLRQALDQALEAASPLYRQANDTYRAQSANMGALDLGQQTARTNMRADDAVARYASLPGAVPTGNTLPVPYGQAPVLASQPEAFRVGYGDQMLTRLDNITPTSNAALPFNTPRQQAMMGEMATDPDLWQRRLQRELQMYETNRAATAGSMTADNIADQGDLVGNVGMAANIATGRFGAVAQALLSRAGAAASGMDEQTRLMVARALLSRDPQAEIATLLQRADVTGQQRRAVEAFIRHSGYQGLSGD